MEDIDDILNSVSRDDIDLPEFTALDYQQLTRFWVAERAAPDLLPWPGPLMERVMERVKKQIAKIEDISISDPTSTTANNPTLNLTLSIIQSDLSRTQYLIRSLLRQRLAKLTKHPIHFLRLSSGSGASQQLSTQQPGLLSPQEHDFLSSHHSLLSAHYSQSFLSSFPPALRKLDDNAGGTSMVTKPETKEVVFVRCLAESVDMVIPAEPEQADRLTMGDRLGERMGKGEVWMVRWEAVREAWRKGEVEVL
ncbi:GINS complex subunit [Ophidiomyces ophidiicola]|uniref:GINS complex subunit n=1 Tax=Ophidiomyces ophidiicola TaxID=1387563 RepID=A0ACB8UTE3_9EURO|nr:GINS complex subunit [Ophidiomyces ophidiicola]KAI1908791.1 GINS complex subunit [Ophidiomyces ophidiicola]KAI1913271.1 GINS complex subunit [Ophidiomyces ophidiicola]KAI1931016.1 GINS complex subunit [Ophidiomyces ophidiicola]KAI1934723.1 GINS complex subunit [Ophidiomyces ophidiicola]KAI1937767.1 GINS complex subunit [Ophidiomyces ophidiicola]